VASKNPKTGSAIGRRRAAAREDARGGYATRRQEIVKVAADIFRQRGFSGTTLNHVAQAMNTDRATLYYYVGGKEELLEEIVGEAVRLNLATATEIRDGDGPAPDKLRRLVTALMQSYTDYYPVLYVLIQENLNHVPPERSAWANEMKRINREYERVLIAIVETGQADGTIIASAPAWLIAYGVIGMVGWTSRWFNPSQSTLGAQEIGTVFGQILLEGVERRGTED
jgi:TetR/AcrR family transcriptional regulator, cholesterol catabolism regulator